MKTAPTSDSWPLAVPVGAGRGQRDHRDDDLDRVVVERAQELRPEKRPEATFAEHLRVGACSHV